MNVFDLPRFPVDQELITILAQNEKVRIEQIVSAGQTTDWYDQAETEFVVLLDGNAEIEFEYNKTVALSKGDALLIRPHEKHRVCFTSSEPPCIWLCMFY